MTTNTDVSLYSSPLRQTINQALTRLKDELREEMPYSATRILNWMERLAVDGRPADYFQHPQAFPALLLPWWLEESLAESPDQDLQSRLVYSTINGYYYVRLIDNVMDRRAVIETSLLPALGFFHTKFRDPYCTCFAPTHPFWELFQQLWFNSADVAIADAHLNHLTKTQFCQIASQKVCAAKIPLAVVCYYHQRPDLIEPWAELVDWLGMWHQMLNDLQGWPQDQAHQTITYFLSEAERRRRPNQPLAAWVATEGFAWGINTINDWMERLQEIAGDLNSPPLERYLQTRQQLLEEQQAAAQQGLKVLAQLAYVLDPPQE